MKIDQSPSGDRPNPDASKIEIDLVEDVKVIAGGDYGDVQFHKKNVIFKSVFDSIQGEGVHFYLPIKKGSLAHLAIRDFLQDRPDLK